MLPTREQAQALLAQAGRTNPGPWLDHSRLVARCAQTLAGACGLDREKAYVLGLLHDIGRDEGVYGLYHVWRGWSRMTALGYAEAARVCLTHSFQLQDLDSYMGKRDVTPQQLAQLEAALAAVEYDDYDKLIQLCDTLAGTRYLVLEQRMVDVALRHGLAPKTLDKWRATLALKAEFDARCGRNLYELLGVKP